MGGDGMTRGRSTGEGWAERGETMKERGGKGRKRENGGE